MKIRSEKIFKTAFFLSLFLFVSCIGIKFYLCNSITVKNGELEEAFNKKSLLEESIERLVIEDANLSSISYVEVKAKEIGFIEMKDRLAKIDLDAPSQVALVNQQ